MRSGSCGLLQKRDITAPSQCIPVFGRGGAGHSPNTPTTGLRERGNDTTRHTGRSGRQNAATRRNMRREERVTVQGPVKEQQPDGMSHGGGGGGGDGYRKRQRDPRPAGHPRVPLVAAPAPQQLAAHGQPRVPQVLHRAPAAQEDAAVGAGGRARAQRVGLAGHGEPHGAGAAQGRADPVGHGHRPLHRRGRRAPAVEGVRAVARAGGGGETTPTTTSTSSIHQLLGAADAQPAHPATSSTAPTHQPLGSANAETTPAGAPAAVADRTQRPDATCEGTSG